MLQRKLHYRNWSIWLILYARCRYFSMRDRENIVFTELDPVKKRTVWRMLVTFHGKEYVGEGCSKKLAKVAAAKAAFDGKLQRNNNDNSCYEPSPKQCRDEGKNRKWMQHFKNCSGKNEDFMQIVLFGDSIIANFEHWDQKFQNFAYGGDRIQHSLYRVIFSRLPVRVELVILHIGTNNIENDGYEVVVDGIVQIGQFWNVRRTT